MLEMLVCLVMVKMPLMNLWDEVQDVKWFQGSFAKF